MGNRGFYGFSYKQYLDIRELQKQVGPLMVPDCVGWYDAGIIAINDGAPISLWNDRSWSSMNLTGSGGTRPTYKTNVINGQPVARFSGNHYVGFDGRSFAKGTYFIVWSRTNAGNNDAIIIQGGSTYPYLQYGTLWYYGTSANLSVAMPANTFLLKCVVYTGSYVYLYTNGVPSGNVASAMCFYPGYIGSGGYSCSGDIAEVIFYGRNLTDLERGQIEAYLNGKYALW
jgi:hypothetical protein